MKKLILLTLLLSTFAFSAYEWTNVGDAGINENGLLYGIYIRMDTNEIPYVSYWNGTNSMKRYNQDLNT